MSRLNALLNDHWRRNLLIPVISKIYWHCSVTIFHIEKDRGILPPVAPWHDSKLLYPVVIQIVNTWGKRRSPPYFYLILFFLFFFAIIIYFSFFLFRFPFFIVCIYFFWSFLILLSWPVIFIFSELHSSLMESCCVSIRQSVSGQE